MAFKQKGFPMQKGTAGHSAASVLKKTYKEAYADRDQKVYGGLNEADYTAEAKRQNKSYKETGKWDAPKKAMTSGNMSKTVKPANKTETISKTVKPANKTETKGTAASSGAAEAAVEAVTAAKETGAKAKGGDMTKTVTTADKKPKTRSDNKSEFKDALSDYRDDVKEWRKNKVGEKPTRPKRRDYKSALKHDGKHPGPRPRAIDVKKGQNHPDYHEEKEHGRGNSNKRVTPEPDSKKVATNPLNQEKKTLNK